VWAWLFSARSLIHHFLFSSILHSSFEEGLKKKRKKEEKERVKGEKKIMGLLKKIVE
jgi:hypothetical protein